jgi:hypothetical protein
MVVELLDGVAAPGCAAACDAEEDKRSRRANVVRRLCLPWSRAELSTS